MPESVEGLHVELGGGGVFAACYLPGCWWTSGIQSSASMVREQWRVHAALHLPAEETGASDGR